MFSILTTNKAVSLLIEKLWKALISKCHIVKHPFYFSSYLTHHFSPPPLGLSGGSYFSKSGFTTLAGGKEEGSPWSEVTWSSPPSFHSPARSTNIAQVPRLLCRRWQSFTKKLTAFWVEKDKMRGTDVIHVFEDKITTNICGHLTITPIWSC